MKIIKVDGKDCHVRRPCYVEGPVTIAKGDKWPTGLKCKLRFPSGDPAIVDRAPIVNSGVCVLGAWNLTNIAAEWAGRGRLIAQDFRVESLGIVHPDTLVDAELIVSQIKKGPRGRLSGKAVVQLSRNKKLLVRISVERFTELRG